MEEREEAQAKEDSALVPSFIAWFFILLSDVKKVIYITNLDNNSCTKFMVKIKCLYGAEMPGTVRDIAGAQ